MAVSGKGLLLGWSIQCVRAVRQSELVCPFGPILDLYLIYYVMCAPSQAKKPHIRAFVDWAEQKAAELAVLRSIVSPENPGKAVPITAHKP